MARILALVPDLHYSAVHTQLLQLVNGLPEEAQELHVVALRGAGPVGLRYAKLRVPLTCLSETARWDLGGLVRLRRLVRQLQPDLIHVWDLRCLRSLHLAVGVKHCPVVLSRPLATGQGGRRVGMLDRWLIRRCRGLVVSNVAQADQCLAAGISANAIKLIRPAVAKCDAISDEGTVPEDGGAATSVIVCVGPLEQHKGFYDAIWAFDVLRHWCHELKLWIVGDGPDAARLRRFVSILGIGDAVRFWGEQDDIGPLLRRALAVWVPSRAEAGHHVALEAMAGGRPVLAAALPGFAEFIADGKTGFLIPPGEKVGFAKKTRALIENADLRRELGSAGRERIDQCYSVIESVQEYHQLYRRLAG